MALITFMSDFGGTDHYVATVKARILGINPGLQIIDISHQIKPFDVAHGAFVLKSVFRDFPKGSIHLVAVDTINREKARYIVLKLEDHFFIGADNGLLSLISRKPPELIAELSDFENGTRVFPTRDLMARAAAMLASGSNINDVGKYSDDFYQLLGRQYKATKKQISGNIIRVDNFGNLITNIEEEIFNILLKERLFELKFGKETLFKIHDSYASVEPGEIFAVFNSVGLLEIGINKGNANELLGQGHDGPVIINFIGDAS